MSRHSANLGFATNRPRWAEWMSHALDIVDLARHCEVFRLDRDRGLDFFSQYKMATSFVVEKMFYLFIPVVCKLCKVLCSIKVHGFTYWGSLTFAAMWGIHLSSMPHAHDFAPWPCVCGGLRMQYLTIKYVEVLDITQLQEKRNSYLLTHIFETSVLLSGQYYNIQYFVAGGMCA